MSYNYLARQRPEKPEDVADWTQKEFDNLTRTLNGTVQFLWLKELHAAPVKVRVGMVVLADGTDWSPDGASAPNPGVFAYYGGAWHKLG